jgi:hypothetical protein
MARLTEQETPCHTGASMTKFNAHEHKPEEQVSDKRNPPESLELQKLLKEESGGDQQGGSGFLDGGELDDWLTAEDEIDHFLHNRQ